MKRLIIFLVLFVTNFIYSQGTYDTYSGFTVPVTPVLPSTEIHPSLWFNSTQINDLKEKKNINSFAAGIWTSITSKIQQYKAITPSTSSINKRPILAKVLAFAWLMNNDADAKQKAIDALLIAYNNVPRTATSSNFGDDYDEIYRATWLQNYCNAYDWLKNDLTPAQDSIIRNKIIEEVLLLRNNMTTGVVYAPRPHNHRSKPAYALVTAALTFSSDTRASGWLQYGLTQLNTVTKYMFSSDGIYREGSHYFIYSIVNCIPYLWNYLNVSGVNHFPYYLHAFEMPLKIRNSKGWMPNIEDSYVKPAPTHMVAAAYKEIYSDLNTSEPFSKLCQWNWFNTNYFTKDYTGATNDVVWDVDEYITYDPTIPQVKPEFPASLRTSSGIVIYRDTDDYNQTPSRHLLFHGVAESDNHQHPDLLSYILEYNGTILSADAGYGKNGFSDSKRSWYISPNSHNTVTVNDAAPLDLTTNIPPTDLHFINAPYYVFSEKSARTFTTNGKLRRGISFPGKKYWVVTDIGTGNNNVPYRLFIHGRGSMVRDGRKVTWTASSDIYGTPQKLYSYISVSSPDSTFSRTGYTSLFKDEVAQSYIEVKQANDTVLFMHLLFPDNNSSSFPSINDLSSDKYISFEIINVAVKDVHVLQKTNTYMDAGIISMDGFYSYASYEGNILKSFSLNDGKKFSFNSKQVLSTSSPVSVAVNYNTDINEIYFDTLSSTVTFSVIPSFQLSLLKKVLLNGVEIPYTISGDQIVFSLSGYGRVQMINDPATGNIERHNIKEGSFSIQSNYPNPFNPDTKIVFNTGTKGRYTVKVFDALGRLVNTIFEEDIEPGVYTAFWNGKNVKGNKVASGTYIFELNNGNNFSRKKGMLLK